MDIRHFYQEQFCLHSGSNAPCWKCPPCVSIFPKEKNGECHFILLIPISFGSLADSVLIQTLAEMTPGMVLDLEVQEVLGDGSVLFSEGPVPGLVLRASKYHRAGECISRPSWFVGETTCPLLPLLGTEFPNT